MSEKNKIRALWPTLFGEFHNENHQNIKKELINFFEDYKKKNPSGRKKSSLGTENYNLYESKYDLHMQKNPLFLSGIIIRKKKKLYLHITKRWIQHLLARLNQCCAPLFLRIISGGVFTLSMLLLALAASPAISGTRYTSR